jgi:hypothetical protein
MTNETHRTSSRGGFCCFRACSRHLVLRPDHILRQQAKNAACEHMSRAALDGSIINYCAAAGFAAFFATSFVAASGVARAVKDLGGGTK